MALSHLSHMVRKAPSTRNKMMLPIRSLPSIPRKAYLSSTTTTTTIAKAKSIGTTPPTKKLIFPNIPSFTSRQLATYGLVTALAAQSFFGSASDFYEYRFIIKKEIDPDDLATFYGSEEFMDIFCMMPIIGEFMMRGGTFDDKGVVHTYGIPFGSLLVSMAFTDETDEDTGTIQWFNKRERFKNVFYDTKLWDQVANFGFHTLDDGKIEVYHHGEYFVGRLPLISLGIKIVFQIHARWVAWATEHHLNHRAFSSLTDEEEEIEELSRTNHMLYMIKYHFWKDFKAMFGFVSHEGSEEESKVSFLSLEKDEENTVKKVLPIKHKATLRKVHDSIDMDKEFDLQENGILDSLPNDNAYKMAKDAAIQRHQTLRVKKRKTLREQTE